MFKYKTISEKENIKNKDFARIIDYFERQFKETIKKEDHNHNFTDMYEIGNLSIGLLQNEHIHIYCKDTYIRLLEIRVDFFAQNISGLVASVRDYLKNNKNL